MKKIIFILIAVITIGLVGTSTNADDKVDHYEGKKFSNVAEAKKTLIETSQKMADIVDDADLDVSKMERVHETSYTTEDAVSYLNKETKADLKELAEKLEEVHLASEGHKSDELRRHYVTYQAELAGYLAQ